MHDASSPAPDTGLELRGQVGPPEPRTGPTVHAAGPRGQPWVRATRAQLINVVSILQASYPRRRFKKRKSWK